MYSALEVFVHAGPVSLVSMSDLDWEKHLLNRDRSRRPVRSLLSFRIGPIEIRLGTCMSPSESSMPLVQSAR